MGKQALQCDRNLLADTGYRKEFSVKKKAKEKTLPLLYWILPFNPLRNEAKFWTLVRVNSR